MSAPAISITALHKAYKGALVPALDGLSLEVLQGSIFGLLGPNGAGKTTTINILCGLMDDYSGDARVFDLSVRGNHKSIRQRLGVVPQHIALYPTLTGRENLMYIGQLYGLNKMLIRERGDTLLKRLGLETHADKRVSRYSGGMKRRVNIIASLLHSPEMVILDEPTAGVDVQSRAMILDFLKEYREGGRTIVYTSHHLEEAEQICDTIAIIDEGKNVLRGTPRELISSTPDCRRLEDVFLHYTGHSVRD
jgi:ABC-2 type transport system ATP-binding protein